MTQEGEKTEGEFFTSSLEEKKKKGKQPARYNILTLPKSLSDTHEEKTLLRTFLMTPEK